MILTVLCYLSLFSLITGVILSRLRRKNIWNQKSAFSYRLKLITSAALAVFLIYLGILLETDSSLTALAGNIAYALGQTVRALSLSCDRTILTVTKELPGFTRSWYCLYAPLLYLLVPLLTVDCLLCFFKSISAYRAVLLSPKRSLYVFSEINEASLAMAESIRQKDSACLIAFTGVSAGSNYFSRQYHSRTELLDAICFRRSITAVNWKLGSAKRKLTFFLFADNEQQNIQDALLLRDCYGMDANASLYILCSGMDSQLLFSVTSDCRMRIRRLDPVRDLIYQNLYQSGIRLFRTAKPDGSGEKLISAVILGLGRHGTQMLKALSWVCQMDGYRLRVHCFDQSPDAALRFSALCPELMDPQHNGVIRPGDAQYEIVIHSGIQIGSSAFDQKIRKIGTVTYVLASLGSDQENVEAAVKMRTLCLQLGSMPAIDAIVSSSQETETLQKATNYGGHSFRIQFIGSTKSLFSWETLFDNELERQALQRHLKWGSEESFWAYEYHYRSSVAAAIHLKMCQLCWIPGICGDAKKMTPRQKQALMVLEHRRWCAYMRSEGFMFSGSTDPASRNDLAKLHNDLVPFQMLSQEEKEKDLAAVL